MKRIFGLLPFIPFFILANVSLAKGQFEEFIFARAAAEICFNVELEADERKRFEDLLGFRKPVNLEIPEIGNEINRLLITYKLEIKELGCDEDTVVSSLATWRYRVTLFASIS